ncbi:MAG TPA: tripartite tricarboxylate transporter TctB family protein [Hyphomicrobiaceae bacterium]|nr:tripartite tricarboxylate transporter TctB family protein [Hyphomicrobiaceae bacterium]
MMWVRNPRDLLAGLLFVAFGGAALVISQAYEIGAASRMGPGYFPRMLGVLLVVLGAVLALRGLWPSSQAQPRWHLRPLLVILAGVASFTIAAPRLGLVVAGFLLVCISSAASPEFRWKEALLSGAIQGLAAVAVFIYGLRIPLPVWPVLLAGGQ